MKKRKVIRVCQIAIRHAFSTKVLAEAISVPVAGN